MEFYKNKFKNKKIFLFAPGPTLNDFDIKTIPTEYMTAGVNGVIIHKEFQDLDFYFWAGDLDTRQHPTPSETPIRNNLKFLKPECIKFTNTTINKSIYHPLWGQTQISTNDAKKLEFITYDINFGRNIEHPEDTWHRDLNNGLDGVSIILASCQILLSMGFSEIVLVGCDCTTKHSYSHLIPNDVCDWKLNQLVERWKKFKIYVEKYFNTKILVVNPIGLKNVFPELEK